MREVRQQDSWCIRPEQRIYFCCDSTVWYPPCSFHTLFIWVLSLTGKPPPFWASWGEQFKNSTTNFNSNAQGWVKGMENRAKTIQMPRWEMPGAGSSLNPQPPRACFLTY